ncbi:MAG TPA: hypothetical protein VFM93_09790, partial [Candidatus Limnocylindria bacterium]|nr:hypothetical protein [Candidatus Limnocylindria bacterium]
RRRDHASLSGRRTAAAADAAYVRRMRYAGELGSPQRALSLADWLAWAVAELALVAAFVALLIADGAF